MIAAQYQQLEAIRFLLSAGVDIKQKGWYGEDACGYARFFNQPESARVLNCTG